MELENLYRGFACPQEGLNDDFLEIITTEYIHLLCRAFLERFGDDLSQKHNILTSFIEGEFDNIKTFDHAWAPVFGEVRHVLLTGKNSAYAHTAVRLALHLQYCGQVGEWESKLTSPIRLRWGRWLLPIAEEIAVQSNQEKVFIQSTYLGVTTRTIFHRYDGLCEGEGIELLPQTCKGIPLITLFPPDTLKYIFFDNIPYAIATNFSAKESLMTYEVAGEILRNTKTYFPWVKRVIRAIIPLERDDRAFHSFSSDSYSGVIGIGLPPLPNVLELAETLVHEASHQYFHILLRLGEVEDGTDSTLYYSPVKKCKRPIKAILIAYHAFANVLLFYRLCRESNIAEASNCLQREEILLPQLSQLESALQTTNALTPLGIALWEPLAKRIHRERKNSG